MTFFFSPFDYVTQLKLLPYKGRFPWVVPGVTSSECGETGCPNELLFFEELLACWKPYFAARIVILNFLGVLYGV